MSTPVACTPPPWPVSWARISWKTGISRVKGPPSGVRVVVALAMLFEMRSSQNRLAVMAVAEMSRTFPSVMNTLLTWPGRPT
ncbi:hypothetical protein D3C78_1777900 [compost metagenome]